MKTIIKIIAFLSIMTTLSCSNDDDTSEPVKEYFPTKITSVYADNAVLNATTTFQYDNNNKISKVITENSFSTTNLILTYNSGGFITLIEKIITESTGTITTSSFNYTYTNNILSEIDFIDGSGSTTINVTYNNSTNTYLLNSGFSFKYDSNNNLSVLPVNGDDFYINYNDNSGVHKNINNSLPIIIANGITTVEVFTLWYSSFYATKEINNITYLSDSFNGTMTRDSNNNISQYVFKYNSTNELLFSSTIEYELR